MAQWHSTGTASLHNACAAHSLAGLTSRSGPRPCGMAAQRWARARPESSRGSVAVLAAWWHGTTVLRWLCLPKRRSGVAAQRWAQRRLQRGEREASPSVCYSKGEEDSVVGKLGQLRAPWTSESLLRLASR
jgi:hypothetical protein